MAVAGLLAQYMALKNQQTYCELQDTRWNDLATTMSEKLSQQTSYQEKWEDSSCAIYDDWGESKYYTASGETFYEPSLSQKTDYRELSCSLYANAKVPKYDPDKLDEYTDLDMEYDTMVSMYDTLIDELSAQTEALKEQLATDAADTGMING